MTKKIIIIHELKSDADYNEVFEMIKAGFSQMPFRNILGAVFIKSDFAIIQEVDNEISVVDYVDVCDVLEKTEIKYEAAGRGDTQHYE